MPDSKLYNHSTLSMNEELVNEALGEFTAATGIPAAIVVDEMEDALGKRILMQDIFLIVIFLVILGVTVFMIVKAVKEKKKYGSGGPDQNGQGYNNNGYNNGYNSNGYNNSYDDRRW